jgi:hypothetical protein
MVVGPWHDLEKIPGEWSWKAICGHGRGTVGVDVVEVYASPHDLAKLFKTVAPFRTPGFVRRQIAGDDVRESRGYYWKLTKIPAAT